MSVILRKAKRHEVATYFSPMANPLVDGDALGSKSQIKDIALKGQIKCQIICPFRATVYNFHFNPTRLPITS